MTEKQIYSPYLDGTLYTDINPIKEAQSLISRLVEKHEVYVATANILGVPHDIMDDYLYQANNPKATEFMLQFLWQYYPEIPQENIIITQKKSMISADALVDDNPGFLINGKYKKILLDKSYNRNINDEEFGICRAMNWDDVERFLLEGIA